MEDDCQTTDVIVARTWENMDTSILLTGTKNINGAGMDGTILHELLPKYHFSERHHVITQASHSRLYNAITNIDLSRAPMVWLLYYVRRMPKASLTLEGMKGIGFSVLGMKRDREYVIGLVGKFWKPVPEIVNVPPLEFAGFNEKGYAKAALNYLIDETPDGIRLLSTETRIYCTSSSARIPFHVYWALIRPFSGLIRRAMLKDILRGAESFARPTERDHGTT